MEVTASQERIAELEAALRGMMESVPESDFRRHAAILAAQRALHPMVVSNTVDDSVAQMHTRPAWGSLEYQRQRYREEARALKSLCEDHDQIEGETIDALRALFSHSDTETLGEAVVALMETWHCRHQPVEWAIIVSLAKLPKALADHIREEGFE